MPIEGDIAANAKGIIPITWAALEDSPKFGTAGLQRVKDNLVYKLFADDSITLTEEEALNTLVKEYAGKCLALELIIPGLDYWAEQSISTNATGREEIKTYANRAEQLRELRKILLDETREMWPDVEGLLPVRKISRTGVPQVALLDSGHTTPNPYDFERPYIDPLEVPQ